MDDDNQPDAIEQQLVGTPALNRWKFLKQMSEEHPAYIKLEIKSIPDPNAPDPDRAPSILTVGWHIQARGRVETERWDKYVRFEMNKRLGGDEPTSITEEQAHILKVFDKQ